MHARQRPTTIHLALSLLVSRREVLPTIAGAITCRMDCRTRSLCACRSIWSAAAMLPHQPCSRSRGGRGGFPAALRPVGSRVRVDTVADHHYLWHGVWRAAAMLPRQPYSRSGAWHTVTHPGHGGAKCARADQRVGQAGMRFPARRRVVAPGSCLHPSGHGQYLPAVDGMFPRGTLAAQPNAA